MNSLARYAFSSLALSAKLHKLLDTLNNKKSGSFDNDLEQALEVLDSDSPLREEAKLEVLFRVKQEFKKLEKHYELLVKEQDLPIETITKLESLLDEIREQIKEKEILL